MSRMRTSPSLIGACFPNLQELRIVNCEVESITNNFKMRHLQRLYFDFSAPVKEFQCPNLTHLWINFNKGSDSLITALVTTENTPKLRFVVWDVASQEARSKAAGRGLSILRSSEIAKVNKTSAYGIDADKQYYIDHILWSE